MPCRVDCLQRMFQSFNGLHTTNLLLEYPVPVLYSTALYSTTRTITGILDSAASCLSIQTGMSLYVCTFCAGVCFVVFILCFVFKCVFRVFIVTD